MTETTTKVHLINMLEVSNQRVIDWFTAMPVENFFIHSGEVWSAAQNVDHLIKAHQPVAFALKIPKFALRAMFGKSDKPSRSYEQLCQIYRDEIAKGAQASGRYLPENENLTSQIEIRKKELLFKFSKASTDLVSATDRWNDKELDNYVLPHPILGKLTVREMLFFTIYHNLRHASREGD